MHEDDIYICHSGVSPEYCTCPIHISERERDEAYRDYVRENMADDDLEIDVDAKVSEGWAVGDKDADGAWVQVWVWVNRNDTVLADD